MADQSKERPCGEQDQVSDHESEPPDRRETGGWLLVIALVEASLQLCEPDPEDLRWRHPLQSTRQVR